MGRVLLLSGLALGVVALGCRLRRRASVPAPPPAAAAGEGEHALGAGHARSGLAVFYAYQMAASRIQRSSPR